MRRHWTFDGSEARNLITYAFDGGFTMLARLLMVVLMLFPFVANADGLNVKQVTMLQTLDQMAAIFSQEYAPYEYKAHSAKLDLAAEFKSAQQKIRDTPDIDDMQFQDLLFDVVHATRDFHVSMELYSTEKAVLPFQVMGAEGRYFVIYIDRSKIPVNSLPGFEIGTEILEFGGKPMATAVQDLIPERYKEPTPTEVRIAELAATNRSRAFGMKVPQGDVLVKVRGPKGDTRDIPFVWQYTPENVPANVPVRNMIFSPLNGGGKLSVPPVLESPYTAGGRSMVPPLGKTLADIKSEWNSGYIFRLPKGHVVGYLRIPTFNLDKANEAAEEFGANVASMNETTDALVIDLTRNPGGQITYMYGLLSRLTDRPLATLPQQMMVSPEMASESAQRLTISPFAKSEEDARTILPNGLPGMFLSFNYFVGLINFDRFILSELRAGRRLTEPTSLLGISSIAPHPTQRYAKPILVLVDELDFSGGDFFPAILQDNKRARIFGSRTAGAGGAVKERQIPNQFNIKSLQYTWTIAQRLDGKPLEGVGVTPDIPYTPTVKDLTSGFEEYRQAVIGALEQILSEK